MKRAIPIAASVLAIGALSAGAVRADQNQVQYQASLGGIYDSNRELRSDYSEELSGSIARADLMLQNTSPTTQLGVKLRVADEYMPDNRDLESDRATVALNGNTRSEHGQLYGQVQLLMDTTLATDVQASTPVTEVKDRTRITTDVGYDYDVSELDQINLSGSAESVDYRDSELSNLSEYDFYGGSVGYSRTVSARLGLDFALFGNRLNNPDAGYDNDTMGVKVGAAFKLSETLDVNVSLGRRKTQYEITRYLMLQIPGLPIAVPYRYHIEDSDYGRVSSAALRYQGETSRFEFKGAYDLLPNGTGDLVERRSAAIYWQQIWSPLWVTTLNSDYWQQRSNLAFNQSDDLNSLQLALITSYRISEDVSLFARLQRLDRKLVESGETAHTNQVVLEIAWVTDPLFFH